MKKQSLYILAALLFVAVNSFAQKTRVKEQFDFDWKFTLGDGSYSGETVSDASWENVQLPHDWSINQVFKEAEGGSNAYLERGIGWYRKSFTLSASSYQGKKVSVIFDGIYRKSDVYINGTHLGFTASGYVGTEYDLTPHLKNGTNVIAVRVDNSGNNAYDFYTGSGIYRHAWLQITNPVRVKSNGTYITTSNISGAKADVQIQTEVVNSENVAKNATISQRVLDSSGKEVAKNEKNVSLTANTTLEVEQAFEVANPTLWTLETPYLYMMETSVKVGSEVVDVYATPFGVRSIDFNAVSGFSLNGNSVKLKGVCLRQDAGVMGVAVPDRAFERRLEVLKEIGCNAIRTGYCPPSTEFLNYCDRLGFLVIDETMDKWNSGIYAEYFEENWQSDLENIITRDRNHPSVILWGLGNEVAEALSGSGITLATQINDFVTNLDPSRKTMIALQYGFNQSFADVFGVAGYNYMEDVLIEDHKSNSNRLYLVSETAPYFSRKGGNPLSYNQNNPWNDISAHNFIAGGFVWAGFDYLGDAKWPGKGFPNGLFDAALNLKPYAAYHRSVWNNEPYISLSMINNTLDIYQGKGIWQAVKTATHWQIADRTYHVLPLQTITNCDRVEIKHGTTLTGTSTITTVEAQNTSDFRNNTIPWNVKWEYGAQYSIQAVGYKDGKEVATHTIGKLGTASSVRLTTDRHLLTADGQDLAFITVELYDGSGFLAQTNDRDITVTITGEGKLIGIENGEMRRATAFNSNTAKTHLGRALVIVQSTRNSGNISVKIQADGIGRGAVVNLSSGKIGVSETKIENMTYSEDDGPSNVKQFTVQGNFISADVSVVASEDFEVSLNQASGFSSSIILPQTDGVVSSSVYVRLKSGLQTGVYTGNLRVILEGEEEIKVQLVGKVESKVLTLIYDFEDDQVGRSAKTPPANNLSIHANNGATAGVVSSTDINGLKSNVLKFYSGGTRNGTGVINFDLFTKESTDYSVTWKQYTISEDDFKTGVLLRGDNGNIGTSNTGYTIGLMQGYLFNIHLEKSTGRAHFRVGKSTSATSLSWTSSSVDGVYPAVKVPLWFKATVLGNEPANLTLEYSTDGTTWKTGVSTSESGSTFLSGSTQFVWGLGSNTTNFHIDNITFEGKTYAVSTSDIPSIFIDPATIVSEEYYNIMGHKVSSSRSNLKGLYIVRYLLSDGTTSTQKVYF